LLDKADRDIQAVSHSLSSGLVRKDGEGEEISRKDPDFTLAARPVAQTNSCLVSESSSSTSGPVSVSAGTFAVLLSKHLALQENKMQNNMLATKSKSEHATAVDNRINPSLTDKNDLHRSRRDFIENEKVIDSYRHCKICSKENGQINRMTAYIKKLSNLKKTREGLRNSLGRKTNGPGTLNAKMREILLSLTGSISEATAEICALPFAQTITSVTETLTNHAIQAQTIEIEKLVSLIDSMREDINHKFCRYEEDNWLSPDCMKSLFDNFNKAWKARREMDFQLRNSSICRNNRTEKRANQPSGTPQGGNKRSRMANSENLIGRNSTSDSVYSGTAKEMPLAPPTLALPLAQPIPIQRGIVLENETQSTENRLQLFMRLFEQRKVANATNASTPL
jgi:hypothetical protein